MLFLTILQIKQCLNRDRFPHLSVVVGLLWEGYKQVIIQKQQQVNARANCVLEWLTALSLCITSVTWSLHLSPHPPAQTTNTDPHLTVSFRCNIRSKALSSTSEKATIDTQYIHLLVSALKCHGGLYDMILFIYYIKRKPDSSVCLCNRAETVWAYSLYCFQKSRNNTASISI